MEGFSSRDTLMELVSCNAMKHSQNMVSIPLLNRPPLEAFSSIRLPTKVEVFCLIRHQRNPEAKYALRSSITTQSPPKTYKIAYTEAKYTLQSSITTQQPPRPPKTTKIAYTEAKYTLRSSITTQQPSGPHKTTKIAYTEAKYAI